MSGPRLDPSVVRRLDAAAGQRVFRAVLDVLANPGRVTELPADIAPGVHPGLLPALALADLEVGVAVIDDVSGRDPAGDGTGAAGATLEALMRATGCRSAALSDADLVVALGEPTIDDVRSLRRGDAYAPELGARLFVACERLHEQAPAASNPVTQVWVAGPGAGGGRLLAMDGIGEAVFETLAEVNAGYPAGVDTWLLDGDRRLAAIPRSCRIELVAGTA